jgi:transaldolase
MTASPTADPLRRLTDEGVAIWLDDMSRERLATDNLSDLVRDRHVVGVTTNPTIFQKAISESDLYDRQLRDLAVRGVTVEEALRMVTTFDVRWACDTLRPVYEASAGVDGRVSIEVDPRLAHETETTVAEARQLWWLVDRPNLFIKIPATKAGLPAISQCLAEGISVNVTLIFSLERYAEVADAYVRGLERLVEAGGDPATVASVASFFVSRVDTETDRRLAEAGREELRGRLGIANAKLAYEQYRHLFAGERWDRLEGRGATPQRCLWASTSVKDANLRDTLYVEELIGPDTISTMPEATIRAFQDHGVVEPRLESRLDEAHHVFNQLYAAGVDYEDIVATLEREGIEKFVASVDEVLSRIAEKRRDLPSAA